MKSILNCNTTKILKNLDMYSATLVLKVCSAILYDSVCGFVDYLSNKGLPSKTRESSPA